MIQSYEFLNQNSTEISFMAESTRIIFRKIDSITNSAFVKNQTFYSNLKVGDSVWLGYMFVNYGQRRGPN